MDAVLKKHTDGRFSLSHKESGWWIGDSDHDKVKAHKGEQILSKLSLKNCQAIERGYDLDELVEEEFQLLELTQHCSDIYVEEENLQLLCHRKTYIKAFQKALEILGDKKFTFDQMLLVAGYAVGLSIRSKSNPSLDIKQEILDFINKMEQTEWEVEVEMWFHGTRHKKGEWTPGLDADGCLILKRK